MAAKSATATPRSATPASTTTTGTHAKVAGQAQEATTQLQEAVVQVWKNYVDKTPQRVKLLDSFLAFLVFVGAVQFAYCILASTFVSLLCSLLGCLD